jgi:hypothetical protein
MTLRIDWDNYEVIEAEDFKPWELSDTIEDVREAMDHFAESCRSIPEQLEELLVALADLEKELEDEDQTEKR